MRRLAAAILAVPVIAWIYLETVLAAPGARRSAAVACLTVATAVVGVTLVLSRVGSSGAAPNPPAPVPAGSAAAASIGAAASPGPADATPGSNPAPSGATGAIAGLGQRARHGNADASTALAADANPAQAASASLVTFAASATAGPRIRLGSTILVRFGQPVRLADVRASLTITPAVTGTLHAVSPQVVAFTPSSPLAPNTTYTIHLAAPAAGAPAAGVVTPASARFLTVAAPAIAQIRPRTGSAAVNAAEPIAVRFTLPMDHATTAHAFSVVVAGHRVPGSVTWTSGGTVLVFVPRPSLPTGAAVGVRMLETATSADGVALARGGSATFRVAAPPAAAIPAARRTSASRPRTGSAQGSAPRSPAAPAVRPVSRPAPPATSGLPTSGRIAGVDVSHHEGPIDWAQVAASGIRFAYAKASEGTDFVDPMYATNRAAAERAGILFGAFHYADPSRTPGEAAAEADHFIATAGLGRGNLVPMLDLEVTNGLSPSEMRDWVGAFLDRIYQRTGLRAGIYVSPDFWASAVGDSASFAQAGWLTLWIAHWTSAPAPRVPAGDWGGMGWTIWQYSDHGDVPGISRRVDVDRLLAADLARLLIR